MDQQLSTQDIVKKSVLENFQMTGELSIERVLITLALAFVIGLFIYFIYKRSFSGVLFSKTFGASLIMISMVTSMIILPISTNLVLSLGMVGALSIVRFRTAVKDPIDTIFMFWAIAGGIMLGAQLYTAALVASAVVGVMMLLVSLFKFKKNMPYLLVIRFDESAKKEVQALLRRMPQGNLKSKTAAKGLMELTIEMRIKEAEFHLVDKFSEIPGVQDVSLISYTGDVVS